MKMKQKILLADDELHIRRLIKDYLTNEHYEVIEAENGEEAIDKFYEHQNYDLIIL